MLNIPVLNHKSRRVTLSIVGIAALGTGAVAVSSGGIAAASNSPAPGTAPLAVIDYQGGQRAPLATAPDATARAMFGVLRQASASPLPPSVTAGLSGGVFTGIYGANLALARQATGLAPGAAWVVPGDGSVCLIAASTTETSGAPVDETLGGASCGDDTDAASGNVQFVGGSRKFPGEQYVAGLVPDGVDTVTISTANGTIDTVPVNDNVYMDTVAGAVSTVTFSGPNGQVVVNDSGD
jgi:hypothetical protein